MEVKKKGIGRLVEGLTKTKQQYRGLNHYLVVLVLMKTFMKS